MRHLGLTKKKAELTTGVIHTLKEAWAQDVLAATSPVGILQANKPLMKLNLQGLVAKAMRELEHGGDQHWRELWKHLQPDELSWEEALVSAHVLQAKDELFGDERYVELDPAARSKTKQCGVCGMTTQRTRRQLKPSWQKNRCFTLR
eukprot:1227529-Amphidinium_carterae.1